MQQTLVILKPSAIARGFVGPILERFQRKGLIISGMKMMQLDEQLLREHYAHLVDRPFFPLLLASMMATPVIVLCLKGVDAIRVVRLMTGATNGREALPGTIRGDFSASGQEMWYTLPQALRMPKPKSAASSVRMSFLTGLLRT